MNEERFVCKSENPFPDLNECCCFIWTSRGETRCWKRWRWWSVKREDGVREVCVSRPLYELIQDMCTNVTGFDGRS